LDKDDLKQPDQFNQLKDFIYNQNKVLDDQKKLTEEKKKKKKKLMGGIFTKKKKDCKNCVWYGEKIAEMQTINEILVRLVEEKNS